MLEVIAGKDRSIRDARGYDRAYREASQVDRGIKLGSVREGFTQAGRRG